MKITKPIDRLVQARSRLREAIAAHDPSQIVSASHSVIIAWAWSPGSEIASAPLHAVVSPIGAWWRVTLDLGTVWSPIVCRVEHEVPTPGLPEGLERCLATLERHWVEDLPARAAAVDGLLASLVLPPEVQAALRECLVAGRRPILDRTACSMLGDRLNENAVDWIGLADGTTNVDVVWPTPPRFTRGEWLADPGRVWAAMETHGSAVLTHDDGTVCGAISKPTGALPDES